MSDITVTIDGNVTPDGHAVSKVRVQLAFDMQDPHAVLLTSYQGKQGLVGWKVSRDLLTEAFGTPGEQVGVGDIKITLCSGVAARQDGNVLISLPFEKDVMYVILPARSVQIFLQRTGGITTPPVVNAALEILSLAAEQFPWDE